jgi:outer membrane scaffolding protein for murein synthesis (MipA/OmpV family)
MVPALLTAVLLLAAAPASGQDAVPIITPTMPNYVGFGLGVTPDYVGADTYFFGGLPLARYQFEDSYRHASLVGTFVDLNVVNHPIIRFGPTAQLRFGRSNVSNRAVRQLPSISTTVEAGVFGGLEFVNPSDSRKRLRLDLRIQQDLASEHEGWLASSGIQGWYPIEGLAEVGLALGTTYGSGDYMSTFFGIQERYSAPSGLPAYDADAGFRDVQADAWRHGTGDRALAGRRRRDVHASGRQCRRQPDRRRRRLAQPDLGRPGGRLCLGSGFGGMKPRCGRARGCRRHAKGRWPMRTMPPTYGVPAG